MLSNLFLVFILLMAGLLVGMSIYDMRHQEQLDDDDVENQVAYDDQGRSSMRQLVLCLALAVPFMIILVLW